MSRTILGGVTLVVVTGLIVGFASGWQQSRRAERELRAMQVQLQSAQLRLAKEVELLREALAAQGALPASAVFSVEAARVPDPAPAVADRREREGGRESRPTPDELLLAFPSLVGEAKVDALRDLVEFAREDVRARDLIVASLGDADPEVREEAVEAIGELADPALFEALSGLTADASDDVREEVAEALSHMPAEQAGPLLAGMLADVSSDVAEQVVEAIGTLGYRGALPQLVDLVRRGDNLELVAEAGSTLRSLGESGAAREAVARIAGALESKDAVDRLAAVRHLRTIGGDEAVAWLRSVVEKDSSSSVRAEAREALARLTRG